jgi:hypothetical protein
MDGWMDRSGEELCYCVSALHHADRLGKFQFQIGSLLMMMMVMMMMVSIHSFRFRKVAIPLTFKGVPHHFGLQRAEGEDDSGNGGRRKLWI